MPGVAANIPADTLAQIESIEIPKNVSFQELAEAQHTDEVQKQLLQFSIQLSLKLQKVILLPKETDLYCDVKNRTRPFISASLREAIFLSMHNLTHFAAQIPHQLLSRGVQAKHETRLSYIGSRMHWVPKIQSTSTHQNLSQKL